MKRVQRSTGNDELISERAAKIFRSYSDEFENYYRKKNAEQQRRDEELFSNRAFDSGQNVRMLVENVRLIVEEQDHPMMMEHYDWLNSLVAGALKQLYGLDRATIVEILWENNITQEFDIHLWVCPRRFGKTFTSTVFLAAFAALLHNEAINIVAQSLTHAQLAIMTLRMHLETLFRVRRMPFVILKEDAEKGFSFLNFDGVDKYGTRLTENERKSLPTKDPKACSVVNLMTTTTTVSYFFYFFLIHTPW